MNWGVAYSLRCEQDIGTSDTDEIRSAIHRFAINGSGNIESDPGSSLIRILAESGFAVARLDEATKTVYVERIATAESLSRFAPLLDVPPPPDSE